MQPPLIASIGNIRRLNMLIKRLVFALYHAAVLPVPVEFITIDGQLTDCKTVCGFRKYLLTPCLCIL